MDLSPAWQEIDQLVSEQKMASAKDKVEALLARAEAGGDAENWARALIRRAQLGGALGTFETAVRELAAAKWPEAAFERSVLSLFYAQSLESYLSVYSWEIQQRERVVSTEQVDLKAWTREQIRGEAEKAFLEVFRRRESWGGEALGKMAEYLVPNNYPPRIRGTLRDAVTYLWVELLADTSGWTPAQSNDVYQLELEDLLAGGGSGLKEDDLASEGVHPLAKIAFLLQDLELWHRGQKRPEAAFEARLERLRRLRAALTDPDDRKALRRDLEARLGELGRGYEWWSMGRAELAEWVAEEDAPDSQVEARKLALDGAEAYPASAGGQHCRYLVARLEAPALSLSSMAVDSLGKRSLLLAHRNLESASFRAYRQDVDREILGSRDGFFQLYQRVPQLLSTGRADAEWTTALPATPDLRSHNTYVSPPLTRPGLYTVVVSAERDFRDVGNSRSALNLLISDLVLAIERESQRVEVTVRSGASGRPIGGVEVSLYRADWRTGHQRVARAETGADGRARFERDQNWGEQYFLVARKGEDVAFEINGIYFGREEPAPQVTTALLFTDRTVYRPEQEVQWKAVAYRQEAGRGRFSTLPRHELTVELVDANGETVESRPVTTNSFGSASGKFRIPAGKLLGEWSLRTTNGASSRVVVEEYKRPTFEAAIEDPAAPLRVNRPARLSGSARYYFGLPVTAGSVAWQVTREPVYPWYWSWWGLPRESPRVVAAGKADLDAEGHFPVEFVPAVDERQASSPGLSFNFRLRATVTDEGGETREASRAFRLGFVAVEASLESEETFFLSEEKASFQVLRRDLDGIGRPGKARWQLLPLTQPSETLLPAEQPLPPEESSPGSPARFRTPGDRLRPRWQGESSVENILSLWPASAPLREGQLEHDAQGEASLELGSLAPGAYRLSYTTEDPFGARYQTSRDFLVAGRDGLAVALPVLLLAQRSSTEPGEKVRLLAGSGLASQPLELTTAGAGGRRERRQLETPAGRVALLELPVGEGDRGGLRVRLSGVRDHQWLIAESSLAVPWDNRQLKLSLSTFRDKLRPGSREAWRVSVHGPDDKALGEAAAELLAYMYDKSLDLFAPHNPPAIPELYPQLLPAAWSSTNLGASWVGWQDEQDWATLPGYPELEGDRLQFFDNYPLVGPGGGGPRRMALGGLARMKAVPAPQAQGGEEDRLVMAEAAPKPSEALPASVPAPPPPPPAQPEALRQNFAETAFFFPHLVTDKTGTVGFEFQVPDSVTEWNVWVHAFTRDFAGGSLHETTRSVKELLVRPYLPRFLREGDRAELKVVVNNAGATKLSGTLEVALTDPETGADRNAEFGLGDPASRRLPFNVDAGGSASVVVPVSAPAEVGAVAVRVVGRAGELSDGELRPLPLLPGRMHLVQSRFAALHGRERLVLAFPDLKADDDPSRVNEKLVVTLDGQLFYSLLSALPYLIDYPYECTEQTLNRYLSTGILSSLFGRYPAVARMASQLAERDTQYERFELDDPNRKIALEESPWLFEAKGGQEGGKELLKVLDPRVARAQRDAALARLESSQTSLGGFPWWPGGPPSPYMTLYLLYGFAKGLEFGIEPPRPMVERAWGYLHRHYVEEIARDLMRADCCAEEVTFLGYVLSAYPDDSWTAGVFTDAERRQMLDYSFRHWKELPPLPKSYLALTLKRMGRGEDAALVFASVMDSARSTPDEGVFWQPEDRSWLWYNDTIESHAFALRTLSELAPKDARRHGLVQWLFLNKKLNHWKSTRATAEVLYSVARYLVAEGTLGAVEEAHVTVGRQGATFRFEPDHYSGKAAHLVLEGKEVDPRSSSEVVVEKATPGLLFASATWHFSTERLPEKAEGDLFTVHRRYFKRFERGGQWVLEPLAEGAQVAPGDQVEVELALSARAPAEYVHLRDPRPAGFEPETLRSGYRFDLGLGRYEEVRDSGTNFFLEWMPAGQYTLRYRLRANLAGTFRVSPATLQSMYAPEFAAYSEGAVVRVAGGSPAR
ncbi:MAG: MG2 domain-containing protein [Thermoanaerobaculia bacterium]